MSRSTLHRATDPETSVAAAERILSRLSGLQKEVLRAIRRLHNQTGKGATAKEIERLPDFAGYGFSTVRKRISELKQAGLIRGSGEDRDGAEAWLPVPITELAEQRQREKSASLF